MPSAIELLAEYKKHTTDIARLEAALELTKKKKSEVVGVIALQHGKGPYDLGDGEEMIITTSKTGTHFFTPRDKWKKKASAKAARASVQPPKVIEATAVLTSGGAVTASSGTSEGRPDATSKTDVPTTPTVVVVAPVAPTKVEEEDPLAAALAEALGSS